MGVASRHIFCICSSELLLLHQLFLRGLHSCLEKWPVIVLSESSSRHFDLQHLVLFIPVAVVPLLAVSYE